jgi:hypothetical protein
MTHLARAINHFMSRNPELSAAEVAKRSRIDPSHLCLLRQGRRGISSKVLKRLASVLCKTRREKCELIAAHLRDESCGYCPQFLEIKIRNGNTLGNAKR